MKVIYVAGKYSANSWSGIEDNIRKAEAASIKLFKLGWAVITPHKNTAHYEIYEDDDLTYETWIKADLEMLRRSDAVFMLDGWNNSKGAMLERAEAEKRGMKIYFQADGYPAPDKE